MEPARPTTRRKPSWGTLTLVVLFHVVVILALARAFAPEFTQQVIERATSALTVTITAPEIAPSAAPIPDEGAAAPAATKAVPREVAAPPRTIPKTPRAAPPVGGAGAENAAGAAAAGSGTGGGGDGTGTGSGNGGDGQGNGARKLEKIAGEINSARDYPVPPGGRQARFGTSVTIVLTVGTDGRPDACRVASASPFPETDATTCRLAMERFRFRPATDRNGNAIVATYGWRQEFREAR